MRSRVKTYRVSSPRMAKLAWRSTRPSKLESDCCARTFRVPSQPPRHNAGLRWCNSQRAIPDFLRCWAGRPSSVFKQTLFLLRAEHAEKVARLRVVVVIRPGGNRISERRKFSSWHCGCVRKEVIRLVSAGLSRSLHLVAHCGVTVVRSALQIHNNESDVIFLPSSATIARPRQGVSQQQVRELFCPNVSVIA